MTTPPLVAPPEAQPAADLVTNEQPRPGSKPKSQTLARPFRLGVVGLGAAFGLGFRLAIANGYSAINFRPLVLAAALTSAVMGMGLLAMAAERDRMGAPLAWISAITALAWGALNWISPPFASSVTVWSRPDQIVLSILGVGNGLLLAGLVALAAVRRRPTMTVAATMLAAVVALASNTVLLRNEWPAIVAIGVSFALVLLAWDRSPRREYFFEPPEESPRISRAALSFISVALCGTAIQLWLSRMSIPRSVPAVGISLLLVAAAFASMVRVRREIEQRETTLSEWTSWMREIRKSDFRAEMENFETGSDNVFDPRPPVGLDGESPRALSFPGLTVADEDATLDLDRDEPTPVELDEFGPADLAAAAADLPDTQPDPVTVDVVPVPSPDLVDIPAAAEGPYDDAFEAAALDALWSMDIKRADAEAEAELARALGEPLDAETPPSQPVLEPKHLPAMPPAQPERLPVLPAPEPELTPAPRVRIPSILVDHDDPTSEPAADEITTPPQREPTGDEITTRPQSEPAADEIAAPPQSEPAADEIAAPAQSEPAANEITTPIASTLGGGGAFSALLAAPQVPPPASDKVPPPASDQVPPPASDQVPHTASERVGDLDALRLWLESPIAASRVQPLLVAVEAMSLDEFESLPADDAHMATAEIESYLTDTMPDADLVSWIDGPYFVVAHASKKNSEMLELNRSVRASLKATNGTLAFLRPGPDAELDEIVDEAVLALLQARQLEQRVQGR